MAAQQPTRVSGRANLAEQARVVRLAARRKLVGGHEGRAEDGERDKEPYETHRESGKGRRRSQYKHGGVAAPTGQGRSLTLTELSASELNTTAKTRRSVCDA